MSDLAIARSSLTTSLRRYRRSLGLWLLLLVAPVGARFMISGEDGKGVAIAIGGHLPVLDGPTLGVWLGIVVSTLLLPVGYIYLRANVTRRQPWQVEEVAPASRVAIVAGRFAADVTILFAVLAALTFAGWFLGALMVAGPLDLGKLTLALWLVAAPALVGLAALRVVFDCVPKLRGGLGDLAFFILWMTSIAIPASVDGQKSSFRTNLVDFAGYVRPLTQGAPGGGSDFEIGGVEVKPGRVALDVMAGLDAPGYASSRATWVGIALLFVYAGGLIYRPHIMRRPRISAVRLAKLMMRGPPSPANPAALPARASQLPVLQLILSEARLIAAGRGTLALAIVAAIAGVLPDYRHTGSPAALLWLTFMLSAHAARCEARGLLALTSTAVWPPPVRRIGFLIAGVGLSVLMALPATITHGSVEPLVLSSVTGSVAALIAIALATVTRSAFAPRLVLLILWYGYLSS